MLRHKIHQLSIGNRNLFGFFSIISLLILICMVSLASIGILIRNNNLLYENPYMLNQDVWIITSGFNTLEKEMYKVLATNSSESVLQTTADILSAIKRVGALLKSDSPYITSLNTLENHLKELTPLRQQIIDALLSDSIETALVILENDYLQHLNEAKKITSQLSQMATYLFKMILNILVILFLLKSHFIILALLFRAHFPKYTPLL